MNYTEIITTALAYSDSDDIEVAANLDNFIKVVEARVNRALDVRKMATRATITTIEDTEYYGLPYDFIGLRDIEIYDPESATSRITAKYLNPEQMNAMASATITGQAYYTIIADQLQILPTSSAKTLEIVYYQRVPNLNETNPVNWLATDNPDAYIFGIMVEINSFVKDAESASMWDSRFLSSVDEIKTDDGLSRWSGTPMQVRLG